MHCTNIHNAKSNQCVNTEHNYAQLGETFRILFMRELVNK
jgi:hypothetical protein